MQPIMRRPRWKQHQPRWRKVYSAAEVVLETREMTDSMMNGYARNAIFTPGALCAQLLMLVSSIRRQIFTSHMELTMQFIDRRTSRSRGVIIRRHALATNLDSSILIKLQIWSPRYQGCSHASRLIKGTILPIEEIGKKCHEWRCALHSDVNKQRKYLLPICGSAISTDLSFTSHFLPTGYRVLCSSTPHKDEIYPLHQVDR